MLGLTRSAIVRDLYRRLDGRRCCSTAQTRLPSALQDPSDGGVTDVTYL